MSEVDRQRSARPRHSALFVPAGNERALSRALERGADVVILDLEDATAPEAKIAAREAAARFLTRRERTDTVEVVLRVNGIGTPFAGDDLAMAARCAPDAVLLPKVEGEVALETAARMLDEQRRSADLSLWAMIETPLGIARAVDIAMAGNEAAMRLDCLVAGTNDLMKETGVAPSPGRAFLTPWLMQVVLAARSAGLDVLDGVYNDFADRAGFEAECAAGRAMGFDGKTVIHPAQIEPANVAFGIDPQARAEAEAIVAAFASPQNAGRGVIALDGRMVERLHLEAAERLLARARLVDRKDNR
ncbi:HpcH/HpaI aldolase/citrate lyase family protein [Pararhizobium mangrovi]|uniref:CoA ester lyase n=1 Tax=Pararhizobium mangrovi TaxID=2590452 RepID=A0A506U2H7_9HYPH|nr:CoA ester lyase [Pararhizobium mangrovi]TPW26077.1 CoA ester lyase [Pararhizobium mangrovi]